MSGKKDKKNKDKEVEAEPAVEAEEGEEGAVAKKKLSGKTLILFIVLPALLVIGGGGAAAMMLLGGGKDEAAATDSEHGDGEEAGAQADKGHDAKAAKKDGHGGDAGAAGGAVPVGEMEVGHIIPGADGEPSYYSMPKMIVNLAGDDAGRPLLMELELVLESTHASTFNDVPQLMPRLMDQIQTFLRELRVEDLNGSAGTYRLRLELLSRFNRVIAPEKLDAVLIEGILIQ